MPKLKTHSGTKKRMKVTGSGQLRRRHAYRSHLLTKKRAARKRNYRREFGVKQGDEQHVRRKLKD